MGVDGTCGVAWTVGVSHDHIWCCGACVLCDACIHMIANARCTCHVSSSGRLAIEPLPLADVRLPPVQGDVNVYALRGPNLANWIGM